MLDFIPQYFQWCNTFRYPSNFNMGKFGTGNGRSTLSTGGSISAFNKDPREYEYIDLKEAIEFAGRSMEEYLHVERLKNLLANLDIEEGFHNMEIEAGKSKIQARELANKCEEYAKLERKVQQMESVFTWPKIMEAIRFYQKLETLRKRFENSRANTIDSQNTGIDFDVWKTLAEKIRKGENLRELVAEIEEPESIDLQLLGSVNEGVENKIIELQKAKSQEIYEPLSWKIFQKESEPALAELQKFENTKTCACAIIFKNNTSETLVNFQTYLGRGQVYIALPSDIQPFCTHNFGQTYSDWDTHGLISYDVGTMRIVLRHYFSTTYNDFGIAIVPLTFSTNKATFNDVGSGVWKNDSTKVKTLCFAQFKVEACVKLENLCLHAELIGTGPKAVLRVLVTAM